MIDVPSRTLKVDISDEVLEQRRKAMGEIPWAPVNRDRVVSKALRAYASMATSAATGAVRHVD